MKMKKKEVIELNFILTGLKELGNTKFKYFVIKNMAILKSHVDPIMEIDKQNKEVLSKFEEERNNLILKLGKQGENNQVYIDQTDAEMMEKFNDGLLELTKTFKQDLDKYNENIKDFTSVLEEEVEEDFNLRTITIDDCPEDGIKGNELEFLIKHNIIT